MRPDRVVVLPPLLDDDAGFLQAVEDFTVQALITQLPIEGLAISVLPGAAGFDVECLCSKLCKPAAYNLRRHLCAIVGPDVFWHPAFKHHVGHALDDTEAVDAAGHLDRQAFPGELVDQGHQSDFAPVMRLRLDKVIAPDMIAMLRSQADAGSVIEPQSASRLLLPGYF